MSLSNEIKQKIKKRIHPNLWRIASSDRFRASLYPIILFILLIILTVTAISGTSTGIYRQIFYGNENDTNLIANTPRSIRSDEWILGTQKIVAQESNDYKTYNQNVGDGEDAIILMDLPAKDWSTVFRPHNVGFFVLPFENAFALRWWIPVFLLAIAAYVFSLALLPKKYLLSSLISIAAIASPFLHWWYGYSTFAILAFALFGLTFVMNILKSERKRNILLYSIGLTYAGVAFVLSFYPPFQIPVVLVAFLFVIGYFIENRKSIKNIKLKILIIIASIIVALGISGLFFIQHKAALNAVATTAYPGERVIESGGYSASHFLSSVYSPIQQNDDRAKFYQKPSIGATNSSESSNFILLMPLLIPVIIFVVISRIRKKQIPWLLISMLVACLLFLTWMFVPNIPLLGKLTLLDKVPHARLLMGWGLVNIILLVVFIRDILKHKNIFSKKYAIVYSLLVYTGYLLIGWSVHQKFPEFLGTAGVFIYAGVFPIIIFLVMRQRIISALFILAVFSVYSVININPLYRGLDIITETPILTQIKIINSTQPGAWVSDSMQIENFPIMAGARSLTGTFVIPQNSLWDQLGLTDQRDSYNRYAHVGYTFDRQRDVNIETKIVQNSPDQFNISIEPCNSFFKNEKVKYLITTDEFETSEATCAELIKKVTYPSINFYIYKLD